MVAAAKSKQPDTGENPQLEPVLANMELRVLQSEYPDERARILNLAGDLCFDSGCRERALSFYGRAIDVHLAAEQLDAAVGVCRKIVRLTPEVVRARCTLAWISLSRGLMQEARERVSEYAAAAAAAGQEQTASRHLRNMTDVSDHQEVLESLADALMQLGDDVGADRAFGAAFGHPASGASYSLPQEPQQRWATVLKLIRGDAPQKTEVAAEAAAPVAQSQPVQAPEAAPQPVAAAAPAEPVTAMAPPSEPVSEPAAPEAAQSTPPASTGNDEGAAKPNHRGVRRPRRA